MAQTGWIQIAILLLVFVGVVGFVLRRLFLPASRDGAPVTGGNGSYVGGHSSHSHDGGNGDGGNGGGGNGGGD